MSEVERVELRAERLRVLVAAIGEEPTMNSLDTFLSGIRPGGWREYLDGLVYEPVARASTSLGGATRAGRFAWAGE